MIVGVVVEEVAEDDAVVVAVHYHVSWVGDEASDPENQCHDQSQGFRQLAMFVEVQKADTEHSETQKDESSLMK